MKARLKMLHASESILNLAPVALNGTLPNSTPQIPTKYKNVLDKFPNLTTYHFKKDLPAHNVVHVIDTLDSEPCKAKLRPIMPGTEKAIKGKKSWSELEALGIVERVDP